MYILSGNNEIFSECKKAWFWNQKKEKNKVNGILMMYPLMIWNCGQLKKVSYYNHSAAGDGGLAEVKDRKRLTKV